MSTKKTVYEKLCELAGNLWWSWQPDVTQIFHLIDPEKWSDLNHNPVLLLKEYTPEQLDKKLSNLSLHSRVNVAYRRWLEYM